ncbi:MAG: hypothetical protein AB2805_07195 [Candidatus Thiodiazotropha sp.]
MNVTRFNLLAFDALSEKALLNRAKGLASVLHDCTDTDFEYICAGLAGQRAQNATKDAPNSPCRLAIVASHAAQAATLLRRCLDRDNIGIGALAQSGHIAVYCKPVDPQATSAGCDPTPLCLLMADVSTRWWDNSWLVDDSEPWLCELLGDTLSQTAELLQSGNLPDPLPLLSMSASAIQAASVNGTLTTKAQHSALFAFQTVALALLHKLGVRANLSYQAVASFSMGEPGGALAAGELSAAQGAAVMAAMSEVVEQVERRGDNAMMVVKGLSETELDQICLSPPPVETSIPLQVEVGAYLKEGLGALTGDRTSLSMLEKSLTSEDSGYWANPKITLLKLSRQSRVAYHSFYFESHREAFVRNLQPALNKNAEKKLRVPYWYNSVSGGLGGCSTHWRGELQRSDSHNPANDTAFWFRCLRERASTFHAMSKVVHDGYRIFLEVNTQCRFSQWAVDMVNELERQHPEVCPDELSALLGRTIFDTESEHGHAEQILAAVADIWVLGCEVDWSAPAYRSNPNEVDVFCRESSLWKAVNALLSTHD